MIKLAIEVHEDAINDRWSEDAECVCRLEYSDEMKELGPVERVQALCLVREALKVFISGEVHELSKLVGRGEFDEMQEYFRERGFPDAQLAVEERCRILDHKSERQMN